MSILAHERVAELELALKAAREPDLLAAAAVEYCVAFRDFRAANREAPSHAMGTDVWVIYNRKLHAIQGRMHGAWEKFEREAARLPTTPHPSNETGPELFSKRKRSKPCRKPNQ